MSAVPLCPTCDQPASEALGGPEHGWECRNEACPEFGQAVGVDEFRERRLAFAIPPIDDPPEDIVPEWLDPGDEDDRSVLIAAAHPGIDLDDEMDPRMHLVMHEIVGKQL